MKKKLTALIVAFTLALAVILPVAFTGAKETASASGAEKKIDIFLLAGQSNAAGQSYVGTVKGTFDNVLYAGETQPAWNATSPAPAHMTYPYQPVTQGLGTNAGYIGPEFGMAQYLDPIYEEKGYPALIFKTAAGGVSLYKNVTADQNYGNYNPAYRATAYNGQTYQGALYRRFIANLKTVIDTLKQNGYTPTIKAYVWMQGECEMSVNDYTNYAETFKTFAEYMREDIGTIMGKTKSEMTTSMPFVIGEISPTGGYGRSGYSESRCRAFIDEQRTIPTLVQNAYMVKSSAFDTDISGENVWHWSGNDMVIIGEMFARTALLEKAMVENVVSYGECDGVFAIPEISEDGTKITFEIKAGEGYGAQTFKVNGTDVSSQVVNGEYTTDYANGNTYEIEMTSKKLKKCIITVRRNPLAGATVKLSDEVKTSGTDKFVYEGFSFTATVTTKGEYEVASVTVNEVEHAYDATTGVIALNAVTEDVDIVITLEKPSAETPDAPSTETTTPDNNGGETEGKSGCGKEAVGLALATFATLIACAFIIKK